MALIELRGASRHYVVGEIIVKAMTGVDLQVGRGEFVSVMGPSGSGKSTLMNIIGCLDKPTAGSYVLDGLDTREADSDEFAAIRNAKIGFVFQGFNLLARTTALENVELPLFYGHGGRAGTRPPGRRKALEQVGLGGPPATTGRRSSREGSSSGSPSRGPWSTTRPSSWPTSRRGTSTPR